MSSDLDRVKSIDPVGDDRGGPMVADETPLPDNSSGYLGIPMHVILSVPCRQEFPMIACLSDLCVMRNHQVVRALAYPSVCRLLQPLNLAAFLPLRLLQRAFPPLRLLRLPVRRLPLDCLRG